MKVLMGKIYDIFFKGSKPALWEDIIDNWLIILCVVLALTAVITVCVVLRKKRSKTENQTVKKPLFDVRSLSFAAMCLAVAFVLSFIKKKIAANGGGNPAPTDNENNKE